MTVLPRSRAIGVAVLLAVIVNVTRSPTCEGLSDDVKFSAGATLVTVCVMVSDVEMSYVALAPYFEMIE